ncbi:alpha/beta fold hydrolase [Undibacterium sp. Tian12W]|uniref:alpha/beta fold hydrolase n=1 Tax=Undibacterium sp. Tian12W TaxID=3413054 RepID=UPI003BF35785
MPITISPLRAIAAITSVFLLALAAAPASADPVKNIILVHGQFADASGWKPVYDILTKDGYNVTMVQEPITSLDDDVAATIRVVARQDGQSILVGHSYGGAVITQAGSDARVAGLVYVAAHAPDAGESTASNKNKIPGKIRTVTTPDGFVFVDPAHFHEDFAGDLPADVANFMARSQIPAAARVNTTLITNPAWRLKPSWYMVAKQDRAINPDLQRMYAARAGSQVVELDGAHTIYISRAKEVAAMIEDAARSASK